MHIGSTVKKPDGKTNARNLSSNLSMTQLRNKCVWRKDFRLYTLHSAKKKAKIETLPSACKPAVGRHKYWKICNTLAMLLLIENISNQIRKAITEFKHSGA